MSKSININIDKDDSILNDYLQCWFEFDSRPNKINIFNSYPTSEFKEVISEMVINQNIFSEVLPSEEGFTSNDKVLSKISSSIYISYLVLDSGSEESTVNEVTLLYKSEDDSEKVQDIIDLIEGTILDIKDDEYHETTNLSTVSISNNNLEITPINSEENEEIELFYTKSNFKSVNKLIKSISKSNKGLSIIYGERGTGKTSLIRYISSKVNRQVIFIPNNMIEVTINNPEFANFIKRYLNPILVIDDCEMLFNEAFTKSNIFANNLLQIVDGFLSDSLNINIITLFNVCDEEEIDHSLMECNNLLGIINIDSLDADSASKLSKYLNFNKKYKDETRLIDVIKKRKEKSNIDIGF